MDNRNIYLNKENITVEPHSSWWKNWFLRLLLAINYLSVYECYKFTIEFSGQTEYFHHMRAIKFSGLSHAAAIVECDKEKLKDEIRDGKVVFFIKFISPEIKEIICEFSKKDHNDLSLIYIRDKEKEIYNQFKIPLKNITTLTFNSTIVRIIIGLIIFGITTIVGLYL